MKRRVQAFARHPRFFWSCVAVAIAAVFIVALLLGASQSTWFDESYSIMLARRSIPELFALTAADAHPPFYYLFLKAWGSVFGWSELALRASSALCGALAVGGMALVLRRLFSERIAVATLPFIVAAPFLLRYDYEIRMYALVMLIGVIATWAMIRARQAQNKFGWWGMYALLVALGMYTLYMSAVFWLAHLVWLIWQDYRERLSIWNKPYIVAYAVAALAFLPWVPTVLAQLDSSALPPYMTRVTITELTNIWTMFITYMPSWGTNAVLTVGLTTVGVLFAWTSWSVWRQASSQYRSGLLLLLLCFVMAIVFYGLISLPPNPPRFMERYMMHVAIFFYAYVGVTTALAWKYGDHVQRRFFAGLYSFLIVVGVISLALTGNYNFQRLQAMQAQSIRHDYGCQDTTYVTAGPFGYIDMRYEFQNCDLRFYYGDDTYFTGGYAPVNGSPDRINSSESLTAKRIIFSYYDDSTDLEMLAPDARYHLVAEKSTDKTHLKIYERD